MLSPSGQWHFRGHNRQREDICIQRQTGHVGDRASDVVHMHRRFRTGRSVRLQHAGGDAASHRGVGIADIDLAAGYVIGPPIQGRGTGQTGDGMFGRSIG